MKQRSLGFLLRPGTLASDRRAPGRRVLAPGRRVLALGRRVSAQDRLAAWGKLVPSDKQVA
jgi:hypothetical protein